MLWLQKSANRAKIVKREAMTKLSYILGVSASLHHFLYLKWMEPSLPEVSTSGEQEG
jgi:hypothetical protein